MSQSKTEKATPKKRKDERKKGNVPISKDVTAVISLLVIFTVFKITFPYIYETHKNFIIYIMDAMRRLDTFDRSVLHEISFETSLELIYILLPVLLASFVVAIIASGMQTRFMFSREPLKPKLTKFNPINGLKKMFSIRSGVDLIKNVIKIIIIVAILYNFIFKRITHVAKMMFLDLHVSSIYVLESVVTMVYSVTVIFVFVAGLDYLFQRWEHERKIKMSKQEVKEEFKQMEGDPQIKGKIKQKQREMAAARMMQDVPSADVVIRNPNHFAIAMRYDLETDEAPIVVAKGQDELALRIVAVAEKAGVMVIEDKPLTRAVYPLAEIQMPIPLAYYGQIAEIFALVYNANREGKYKNIVENNR